MPHLDTPIGRLFAADPLLQELRQCSRCRGTGVITCMLPTGGGMPLERCKCGAYERLRASPNWQKAPKPADGYENHVHGVYVPAGLVIEWSWDFGANQRKRVTGYRITERNG